MRSATTKKSSRLVLITALVAVLVVAAGLFLFRSSTYNNPALGLMTTKYRWGKPAFLLVDVNRDGTPDAKAVAWHGAPRSPHDAPKELWESTRCDGYYDLHALFDRSGNLSIVEFDTDRDGAYEKTLSADEGRAYWSERERPLSCRPQG